MLCALILAGGVGSRFWPQSTEMKPKQFLSLLSDKTMLQMTYERINKLVPKENIFIVTNINYVDIIKKQINNIKDINIILEPCSKNTAPCILLSSLYIKSVYKDSNVICVTSDSYIQNEDKFIEDLIVANKFVSNKKDAIVTIGIEPTRAETGYGYIKYEQGDNKVLKVSKFVEKPNSSLAQKYYESKEYLWNAGMFIFNTESILKEFKSKLPKEYELLSLLPKFTDRNYLDCLNENYNKCDKISMDYAIIEKSNNIYTIPTNIGWDDVGTWNALERYLPKDSENNIIKGDIKLIDSSNNIVYSSNKKIVLLNVDGIFCIDSDDVIVIGNKDNLDKVHELKNKI
ncbi:MAG: sugar phosphate nucleotidyltransferase [Clostridium sp.]|nr:sugar phosphate nucleotidyltransferase [Clostridium sp.]MCM1444674.1 sugar phosphate nucleotidyltransferase [Candidatus Amulumruptor caecigallinarius]